MSEGQSSQPCCERTAGMLALSAQQYLIYPDLMAKRNDRHE